MFITFAEHEREREGKKGRLDGNWIEGSPREGVLPWERQAS